MINTTICFLPISFQVFKCQFLILEGIMVRICSYVPRPMKFAAFIDESVEKNNQFQETRAF